MSKKIIFLSLMLLVVILAGCVQAQPLDAPTLEQLDERLAAVEARLDQLPAGDQEFEARLAALEEKVNSLEMPEMVSEHDMADMAAEHEETAAELSEQEPLFQVIVATYLMDTAGFHDIDERINEEGTIMPGDAGVVERVQRVLSATAWPQGLEVKAGQLITVLGEFAEVLANDDVEAAKPLAAEVHEVQHDLSHAVENWLAQATGSGAGHAETGEGHSHEGAHVDHSGHHSGLVGMSGDLHLEIVSEAAGEYRVYITDALRQPIDLEGISGSLVLRPGANDEETLPFQIMDGEYLVASGGPAEVDTLDVSIRLDGTPEGHVEMDFTLSHENGHGHD